jgi:AraC family transcriptional regulator
MRTETYRTASELKAPGVSVQMRVYANAPAPGVLLTHEHNVLGLIVDKPAGSRVRQYALPGDDVEEMGVVGFHALGVPWEFFAPAGSWTSVVCEYEDDELFEEIVGASNSWNPRAFRSSRNIRSASILQLMRLIESELRTPGFASCPVVETLTTGVLHYLTRYLRSGEDLKTSGCYALSQSQLRLIDERLQHLTGSRPTVAELAGLCGLSVRHLLRKFKHSTGHTISEYIARAQLTKAKHLLAHTDLPIKVITYQLGFSSPSSFGVAFRDMVSVSPSQFRHRLQGIGRLDGEAAIDQEAMTNDVG